MKAEALIWKNGEGDAEAKQLLNRIRKRARLPENSPATKAELKNQRRCELAFEFMPSRHLDMVRWGDAKEAYA
ncbi:MAG: RagB/SusD family nutrient uptake outer membrane protein [Alistipes onderdonkii]